VSLSAEFSHVFTVSIEHIIKIIKTSEQRPKDYFRPLVKDGASPNLPKQFQSVGFHFELVHGQKCSAENNC
jgi:hypothetical protein